MKIKELLTSYLSRIRTMISNVSLLENLVYWTSIFSLCAIAITVVCGSISLISSRVINKAKSEQMKIMELRIAETEQKNIVLKTELANAQKSVLELQKQIEPRYLTEEQRDKLFQLLRKDTTLGDNIMIACSPGEEPVGYANQLSDIFKRALWHDPNVSPYHMTEGYPQGINIMVKNSKNTPSHALRIKKAFAEVGISAKIIEHPIGNDQIPVIFIGPK